MCSIPVELYTVFSDLNNLAKNPDQKSSQTSTPYSMNRLFSEFFRKFGGAFLEVCETISGGIWQVLRGKIKDNYLDKK